MADNITYRFIQNVGEYFPPGFFTEDFCAKVQTQAGLDAEAMKSLCAPFVALRRVYEDYKNFIVNDHPRIQDAILRTHEWHTALLKVLGYPIENAYAEPYVTAVGEEVTEMIPVRSILRSGDRISMLIMEMQNLVAVDECEPAGLFEQQYESADEKNRPGQRYSAAQWSKVIPAEFLDRTHYRFSPAVINKAVTQIFLMPEERRPKFILMLAGNTVFLFGQEKWARGAYLQFSIDDLYAQAQLSTYRNHYALFHLLVCKQTLAADGETALMDELIEQSYKNAYEVTKDLKEGVILAVETLANEALHYMRTVANRPFGKRKLDADGKVWYDETDDSFEAEVKDDCLVIVYRLLFILFAESRPELDILPTGDEVYKRGYSFEALRDLEQVRLVSDESRNGYFFDDSVRHLFAVLAKGYNMDAEPGDKSFRTRPVDSPIFDNARLKQLGDVRVRNVKWQEIIRALSLSHGKKHCGRISYANLGVNQLGSVYESLLAYRGFYAEEDYIEVHKAGKPEDGTWLVPYSRMGAFDVASEVVLDEETGEPRRLAKGTFVYRLNGRDRQKSASYYTPEVLTRSTVKYTIKSFVDEVRSGKRKPADLLDLKILEPAVGAAAFLNEAINQVAEAYMAQVEKKPAPDRYRDELQKVKAYIATHNVYGVDLNPTAIELGKLSLWLNVIHKDMETPFFSNRIAVGNAVIGAWLKCYSRDELLAKRGAKCEWWTKAPHAIGFFKSKVNRPINDVWHFLLPDKGMLAALGVKEMKKAHPDAAAVMAKRLKDWIKPISAHDFHVLQRISAKIDVLLKDVLQTQLSIDQLTANKANVWGVPGAASLNLETFAVKECLLDTRNRHDNAFYKLKLVMDYWCALWFWNYEDHAQLPTREEWWAEVEKLLAVSELQLSEAVRRSLAKSAVVGQAEFDFTESVESAVADGDEKLTLKSKEELLKTGEQQELGLEPERFTIVRRLSERYRFFHPMLEFIEVFWLRGGFDIICGNPPWLKLQFDDKAVMSERYPEVMVHKVSAPDARAMKDEILKDANMCAIYEAEELETECTGAFLNAASNYPLLVGQQTNLYKCILTNCFSLVSDAGYIGILCPESIYDDPNGQPLRRELYHRLKYHFQYQNELRLFAEVHHHTVYGDQLLGPRSSSPNFLSIHNLFHPNTVDACFNHSGQGECGGIKDKNGKWNTAAHAKRIVNFREDELRVLAKTFEDSDDWEATKLVSIHNAEEVDVLASLSKFPTKVNEKQYLIKTCFDETGAVDKGYIKRLTVYPDWDRQQMVFNGPQFFVSHPLYKTPRSVCRLNSDYDIIDMDLASDDESARTNYVPCLPLGEYRDLVKGFEIGQDKDGMPIFDCWMDYFKVAFRHMASQEGERTLICAVLPSKTAHIHGVISVAFRSRNDAVDMISLCSSLVMDYYIKKIGASNLMPKHIEAFPLGIADKYKPALFARTLRLNCVTNRYAELWCEVWDPRYREEKWSIDDPRLASWDKLTSEWQHETPLRNYFERRQALVEIDVLAAMALGLTLDELIMMYEIQFPVLQQNENDTWYDRNGRIVFTCSKGLVGVGLDRPTWNTIKDQHPGETYEHTLTSELYNGRKITYEAPYRRCDRVADYRRAWAFFEERLKGL